MLRKHKKLGIMVLLIFLIVLFFYWQNNDIVITNITYSNQKIPKDFIGFKIVQVSDLHNKKFGEDQSVLLEKIRKTKPDIIVVTGDIIDSKRTNIEIAMEFIHGSVKIAPVYYVTGNHEAWSNVYNELEVQLQQAGVVLMDNKKISISRGDSFVELYGMPDPDFKSEYSNDNTDNAGIASVESPFNEISIENQDILKILLSHRPELIEFYVRNGMDLVFTGHAHGGQVRLPFLGGLVAPNQGFLPEYTSGTYTMDETTEIVSRGLGNSIIPVRVFNRPELIVCIFE